MEPENKKNPLLKILLLDIGEFVGGAIVAVIIFAALFFVLNYFNILSLASIYKPLSFLPHQASNQTYQTKQQQNTTNAINLKPSISPAGFQYDVAKAKQLLTQYIMDTLKPEFILQSIDIKQGQNIDGAVGSLQYEFGFYLPTKDATISANLHYKENTNVPNDMEVFILLSRVNGTATPSLAASLASRYFQNPYTPSPIAAKTQQNPTAKNSEPKAREKEATE